MYVRPPSGHRPLGLSSRPDSRGQAPGSPRNAPQRRLNSAGSGPGSPLGASGVDDEFMTVEEELFEDEETARDAIIEQERLRAGDVFAIGFAMIDHNYIPFMEVTRRAIIASEEILKWRILIIRIIDMLYMDPWSRDLMRLRPDGGGVGAPHPPTGSTGSYTVLDPRRGRRRKKGAQQDVPPHLIDMQKDVLARRPEGLTDDELQVELDRIRDSILMAEGKFPWANTKTQRVYGKGGGKDLSSHSCRVALEELMNEGASPPVSPRSNAKSREGPLVEPITAPPEPDFEPVSPKGDGKGVRQRKSVWDSNEVLTVSSGMREMTLGQLASHFGVTVEALTSLNAALEGLGPDATLPADMAELVVPGAMKIVVNGTKETLRGIALRFGVPADDVERLNPGLLLDQSLIAGSTAMVPRCTTYVVAGPGETVASIAWKTGVAKQQILLSNPDLVPGDELAVGTEVYVPRTIMFLTDKEYESADVLAISMAVSPTEFQSLNPHLNASDPAPIPSGTAVHMNKYREHIVRVKKESLAVLALRNGLDVEELRAANPQLEKTDLDAGLPLNTAVNIPRATVEQLNMDGTLADVALRLGIDITALRRCNPYVDADESLVKGTVINIPLTTTQRVQAAGEHMSTVARRAGVSLGTLAECNPTVANDKKYQRPLYVGQELQVPRSSQYTITDKATSLRAVATALGIDVAALTHLNPSVASTNEQLTVWSTIRIPRTRPYWSAPDETIATIAQRFGMPMADVVSNNEHLVPLLPGIASPDALPNAPLPAGALIHLPWCYAHEGKSKESVEAFAARSGVAEAELLHFNNENLRDGDTIQPGQRFRVPYCRWYTVASRGENLHSVACKFGLQSRFLARFNNWLSETETLTIGQTLHIPSIMPYQTMQDTMTLSKVAKSFGLDDAAVLAVNPMVGAAGDKLPLHAIINLPRAVVHPCDDAQETVESLSRRLDTAPDDIKRNNPSLKRKRYVPLQFPVAVPIVTAHDMHSNDTVQGVADMYSTTLDEMRALNRDATLGTDADDVLPLALLVPSAYSGQTRNTFTYYSRSGDTVASIAQQFGIDELLLRDKNPSLSGMGGRALAVGTAVAVVVPPGVRNVGGFGCHIHVSRAGDTLHDIARLYSVATDDVMECNKQLTRGDPHSRVVPLQNVIVPRTDTFQMPSAEALSPKREVQEFVIPAVMRHNLTSHLFTVNHMLHLDVRYHQWLALVKRRRDERDIVRILTLRNEERLRRRYYKKFALLKACNVRKMINEQRVEKLLMKNTLILLRRYWAKMTVEMMRMAKIRNLANSVRSDTREDRGEYDAQRREARKRRVKDREPRSRGWGYATAIAIAAPKRPTNERNYAENLARSNRLMSKSGASTNSGSAMSGSRRSASPNSRGHSRGSSSRGSPFPGAASSARH